MASGSRRTNRRKYASDTNDHVAFAFVILLAAALYTHQAKYLVKEQSILDIVDIAIALLACVLLLMFIRKLSLRHAARRVPYSLIDSMSGVAFERHVAKLLPDQGFKRIRLTERYDFGFDIIAEKEGVTWGIQVKRYSGPVKMDAVRQAVAALKHYDCERAMVITNSSFSAPARELALSNNCVLVDRQQLIRWSSL